LHARELDVGLSDYELFMVEVFGGVHAEPTIAALGDVWFDATLMYMGFILKCML